MGIVGVYVARELDRIHTATSVGEGSFTAQFAQSRRENLARPVSIESEPR
jgi:hypothetical protein